MPDFYCEQREIKLSPNSVQNESLEQVLLGLKNPSARRDYKKAASKLWNRKPIGTTWNYPMLIPFDFTYFPNFHRHFLYIVYFSSNLTRIFQCCILLSNNSWHTSEYVILSSFKCSVMFHNNVIFFFMLKIFFYFSHDRFIKIDFACI